MRRRARFKVGRSARMVGDAMCRSLPQLRGSPDPLVLQSLRDEKNLWLGFWLSPRSGQGSVAVFPRLFDLRAHVDTPYALYVVGG
jgi:hypothetical protein